MLPMIINTGRTQLVMTPMDIIQTTHPEMALVFADFMRG
jgi:hypothetical protein